MILVPKCVVCGELIDETKGETPVYVDADMDVGQYDGQAYHKEKCEDEVFEEVHCEL